MFKLAKYLKGYRAKTIIGPFFKLFEAFFELITPLVVAWVIDTAIPRGRSGDFSGLWIGGGIILALGVLGLAFTITAQFSQAARPRDSARIFAASYITISTLFLTRNLINFPQRHLLQGSRRT